jgi:hypothetical protein
MSNAPVQSVHDGQVGKKKRLYLFFDDLEEAFPFDLRGEEEVFFGLD